MRSVRLQALTCIAVSLLASSPALAQAPRPDAKPAAKPAAAKPAAAKPAAGTPAAPAAAPPAVTPPAGGAAPAAPAAGPEPTAIRLRSLEERVQALKEKSWRMKARVDMLKVAVLGGGIGARARIVHKNRMGGEFKMVKLVYALDGTQIFAKTDESGKLNAQKEFEVLSGPVEPGNHTISLLVVYLGSSYGLFPYMKGYKFTVRSSHTFAASEGKTTQITADCHERGGVTTPVEQKPAVNFKVNVMAGGGQTATAAKE